MTAGGPRDRVRTGLRGFIETEVLLEAVDGCVGDDERGALISSFALVRLAVFADSDHLNRCGARAFLLALCAALRQR